MTDSFVQRDPVEQLAEEFLARLRSGQRPSLSEYTGAHPDLADEIRDLFPTLVMMEEAKPGGAEPHPRAAAFPEAPPDRLGDYRVLREVARGGMGVVYEAEQVSLGRHVALKILPARADGDPLRLLRFRREARSAARLHHTNIIPVFDVGAADGIHYYAMQFIQGQGLDEVLRELCRLRSGAKPTDTPAAALTVSLADGLRTGEFPGVPIIPVPAAPRSEPSAILTGPVAHYFRSVARLGVQAADALAYAHGQRVLHRDVKPSNLLLDRQGTLWLTDFGLAKDDGDDLTRTGDIVGTLRYMAPERFQGVSDPRSDVYALGITLYELLTLRPAFPEVDRVRLVHQIANEHPPRLRLIDPTIPRDLETVVLKAIEKDPARRYPQASDLAEDLRRVLSDRPVLARRASWSEQAWRWGRRNPGVAASLSAAVVLLVLGIAVSTGQAVRATRAEGLAGTRLEKEVEANHEARQQLFKARLAEATASRYSRRAGQRFNGLRALTEAVALARELDLGDETLAGLRDDAIACLSLADVQRVKDWEGVPAGSSAGVAFDADLRHYARSDQTGIVSVLRVSDDEELVRLPGHGGTNSGAAVMRFSPDGTRLAVAYWGRLPGGETNFRLWDWQRREGVFDALIAIAPGCFDFSPDGRGLAATHPTGAVSLLDADTGRPVWQVTAGDWLLGVSYHPDGSRVAVGGQRQRALQIRRSDTGELLRTLPAPKGCEAPVWHPDGDHLAAGAGRAVRVYDAIRPAATSALTGHQAGDVRAGFHPGSGLLLSWGGDGMDRLWDVPSGREVLRFEGGAGWFSRDGLRLATQTGHRLNLWDVAAGHEYRTLSDGGNRGESTRADISPDGRCLAQATVEGVQLSDLGRGKEIGFLAVSRINDVKFHPRDPELYTSGLSGVDAWAVRPDGDGMRIRFARRLALAVRGDGMSLDRDGRLLAVACGDAVRVFDLRDPSRTIPGMPHRNCTSASISPDGRWVASGTNNGHGVRVRDVGTGETREFVPEERSTATAFSPDGRWLVVSTGDGHDVLRVGTWERTLSLPREQSGAVARRVVFSPDGMVLAVPLSLSAVRLVDASTWRPLARLQSPESDATELVGFSPDGGHLTVRTLDGHAHLWDLRLIREQLHGMRLDWDQLPYPPAPTAKPRPLTVEVDLTGFAALAAAGNHWREGTAHFQAGRWREAAAGFSKVIELSPTLADAYQMRGEAHLRLKEWHKAVADTTEAIRLQPESAPRWNNRGLARAGLGQWDEAVADFSRAIELNPKYVAPRHNRGEAYAEKGQWDQAEADFVKVAELAPDKGRLHYHQAVLKLARRDLPGYRKACAALLANPMKDLSPGDALSAVWACVLTPDSGVDPAQVVRAAERGLEVGPKDPDILQKVGAALYRAGRHEAAVKVLTEAEAVAAGTPYKNATAEYTWLFLAMAQHHLGRVLEARQWLDRVARAGTPVGAPWNRRQTLGLIRREAEELLKPGTAENPPKRP